MTFVSHCLFLFIYLLAATENGSPQIVLKNLMGQASSLDGKFLSELLLQSGVNSALSGWEPSPQATSWWALEGVVFLWRKRIFACDLSMLERNGACRGAFVCLTHFTAEDRSYTSPLTWVSELGLIPGYSTGFTTGLTRRLAISALRKSAGASQCVYVLACVSVCWRWGLCIIARASGTAQTSPWKTVSHH